MRYRTEVQEKLYQYYLNIGNQYPSSEKWRAISQSGIWKLPIEVQHGGKGLKWDDFLSALEGLVSSSCDISFISNLVSQYTSLYLVNKYGKNLLKKNYLSLLMKGSLSAFVVNQDVLKSNSFFFENDESEIKITINCLTESSVNNHIEFLISRKIRNTKEKKYFSINELFIIEKASLALRDFIEIQKIVLGVLLASSASSIMEKFNKNNVISNKLDEIKKDISSSKNSMYQSLNIKDGIGLIESPSFCVH